MENHAIRGEENPEIVALSGQTVDEVKEILVKHKDPIKDKLHKTRCRSYRDINTAYKNVSSTHTYNDVKADCVNLESGIHLESDCSYNVFGAEEKRTEEKIKSGAGPKLVFEDCGYGMIPEIRSRKTNNFDKIRDELLSSPELRVLAGLEQNTCPPPDPFDFRKSSLGEDFETYSRWRKTAGIKQECDDFAEGSFNASRQLMDFIKNEITSKFPKLEAEWTSDSWNPRLLINNSPTQVSLERIAVAYKGLMYITDELNTKAIIANIVLKKLKELFI
jgi:hypothetical protein